MNIQDFLSSTEKYTRFYTNCQKFRNESIFYYLWTSTISIKMEYSQFPPARKTDSRWRKCTVREKVPKRSCNKVWGESLVVEGCASVFQQTRPKDNRALASPRFPRRNNARANSDIAISAALGIMHTLFNATAITDPGSKLLRVSCLTSRSRDFPCLDRARNSAAHFGEIRGRKSQEAICNLATNGFMYWKKYALELRGVQF